MHPVSYRSPASGSAWPLRRAPILPAARHHILPGAGRRPGPWGNGAADR